MYIHDGKKCSGEKNINARDISVEIDSIIIIILAVPLSILMSSIFKFDLMVSPLQRQRFFVFFFQLLLHLIVCFYRHEIAAIAEK
jgi:hypothetical protein